MGDRLSTCLPAVLLVTVAFVLGSARVAPALGPPEGLDARAWELVSPVAKNGGDVGLPGTFSSTAGVQQAAAQGGVLAFGSAASFGDAAGALPVNQYLAFREESGWRSVNVTPQVLSGTYEGGAYQLLSSDLSDAVLGDGTACRDGSDSCPVEGLLAPGGPSGYRNVYLRRDSIYLPLITAANSPALTVSPEAFRVRAVGGDPELEHIILSTCAALTADATEVPMGAGCDPQAQNLYESDGQQLELVNRLPGDSFGTPGAALAAGDGALAGDGSRLYWTQAGDLYVTEGAVSRLVAQEASFGAASADGAIAFYLKDGALYRYDAGTGISSPVTAPGPVSAVIGSSTDGSVLYYVTPSGLFRLRDGVASFLFGADPSRLPPAAGRSRVSKDGNRLFFNSSAGLRPSDTNGVLDVYEWEAGGIGSCSSSGGCLALISSGRLQPAGLVDASDSGDDVFFATAASLLPSDPGSFDIYDARSGGGFPEPSASGCEGDDCQGPVEAPVYELPATASLIGIPNPPASLPRRCSKHKPKHKHRRCAAKKRHHQRHTGRGR
jgi:hypothetical protein